MKHIFIRLLALLLLVALLIPMLASCAKDGTKITIGENGNWYLDGVDSGISAKGEDGTKVTIGENGNWYLDGKDSGIPAKGANGTDGTRVTVGPNGNWFLDGEDTGISAKGKDGTVVTIGTNGNWYLDGKDSGVPATGPAGEDGQNGTKITVGTNGNWHLDGVDTGIPAKGADGKDGENGTVVTIGENGNWHLDGVDTGIPAKGADGKDGENGTPGQDGKDGTKITIGANGNWYLDGKDSGVPATGTLPPATPQEPEKPAETFTPVTRFVITSDIHYRSKTVADDQQSNANLEALFTTSNAYASTQTYNRIDGLFVAGDFTQNGKQVEMDEFKSTMNRLKKSETNIQLVLGNHEFWDTGRYTQQSLTQTFNKYTTTFGYDAVDRHVVIGGYHCIILNMNLYDNSPGRNFSEDKLAWLDSELQKAAAEDPTGKKPIFVFQHMVDNHIGNVLKKYPQVIDFSGHTHRSLVDPYAIQQDNGYTSINTGSLAYIGMTLTSNGSGSAAMNASGAWATGDIENGERTGCLYYIVEIDANQNVRLVINNIYTDKVEKIIELGVVGDPSTYTFKNDRKDKATTVPTFASNAKITLYSSSINGAVLHFPQATGNGDDPVNSYRIEVYKGTSLVKTLHRHSCQYLGGAAPTIITAPLTGLSPDSTYTVKIYAHSFYNKVSQALEGTFTIGAASTIDPLTPNVLQTVLNADGTATNAVDGTKLGVTGTPGIVYDSTLKRNVAVLDGKSGYRFVEMSAYYNTLSTSFTFTTYVYIDQLPAKGTYVDLLSNQESGGYGFELKDDGKVYFYCHLNGGYQRPGTTLTTGTWHQLAATYDGYTLKFYLDGQLAGSYKTGKDTPVAVKAPNTNSQYLAIGGDSAPSSYGNNLMTGKIAMADVYSYALTDEQVLALYRATK